MHDTVRELERKTELMQLQMQLNTSRNAASCAAPAADGAPAQDIKFDPQQQSAIISFQDQNLALEMQSI
jgi:hypothetical protein